jgi:hypothetical protein
MKKKINIIVLISIVIIKISIGNVFGQTTVQVVTKTIDGNEKWTAGVKLEVVGENAIIYCESHPGNSISYEIQIIAKHTDKEKAELDLKKMKWISGKQGKTLFMRNYIELASEDALPESMLKVIYHIKIPETCPLTINNYFGEITVENTKSTLNINSEFARIELINIQGEIKVETKFGDISGKFLNGLIEINSNRSNIQLEKLSGTIDIDAVVAEINLGVFTSLEALNIEAEKSKIKLEAGNKFRYILELDNTDFEKPVWMLFDPPEKKPNIQKVNFIDLPDKPLIQIKQRIGTLEIN